MSGLKYYTNYSLALDLWTCLWTSPAHWSYENSESFVIFLSLFFTDNTYCFFFHLCSVNGRLPFLLPLKCKNLLDKPLKIEYFTIFLYPSFYVMLVHETVLILSNMYISNIYQHSRLPEKRKKNPPGTRDKDISNHRPGGKRKNLGQKERPTPSHQLKKIKIYAVSWSKEN